MKLTLPKLLTLDLCPFSPKVFRHSCCRYNVWVVRWLECAHLCVCMHPCYTRVHQVNKFLIIIMWHEDR